MPSNNKAWQYILFGLFALSGFSGLIYESVWSQYLKLFLGHAAYAQNLVLAIFMGGMAAGAWLASRFMGRLSSPLMGYVVIELLIGVFGLLFHGVFLRVTGFMLDNLLPGMQSPLAIDLARWSIAALLILPQTLLLGATFPLMSSGILRCFPQRPGSSISLLYFSNSLGAVVGVLAAGFWLVGKVGLPGTMLTAALVNFLLAFLVYGVVKQLEGSAPVMSVAGNRHTDLLRPLLLVSLITGLSSFVYEIGWIRMLSLVLGASTHAFELMLSAFILGLALGGLWIRRRIDGFSNPLRVLGVVQLLMGLLALGTVVSYNSMFDLMAKIMSSLSRTDDGYLLFNLGSNLVALLVMLPVTFMAGMTLPLVTYVLFREGEGESAIGKVYAANTLGAIIGVWLTVQVLMPFLGLKATIIFGAILDIVLGAYLFNRTNTTLRVQIAAVGGCFLLVLLVSFGQSFDVAKMVSNVYRSGALMKQMDSLFHKDGKTATIDVYKAYNGLSVIATNGKPDAAVAVEFDYPSEDEPTMVLTGALPLLVHPHAKTAAVIGMGSGISANLVLSSPYIESLDVVEIESAMVEGARHFGRFSDRVYSDPRSHIHIDDAKSYFSAHRKHYDVVISEPSNPWVSGVANLFGVEFYGRIAKHLNEDGILIQWFQGYENNFDNVSSIVKALSVQFDDYRLYAATDADFVLVAKKKGALPQLSGELFGVPAFRVDMARVAFAGLQDVELHEVGDRALLEPFFRLSSAPANSDYFPFVDQRAVRARFKDESVTLLQGLKSSPVPLPGSNFYGALKTNEMKPSISYSPRYAALQSQAIARYLGADNSAGSPVLMGSLGAYFAVAMAQPKCGDKVALRTWRTSVAELAAVVTPYLTNDEMSLLVGRLKSHLCQQDIKLASGMFLDVMMAVGRRDASAMKAAALAYLGTDPVGSSPDELYALHALLFGQTMLKEHDNVLQSFARLRGQPTPAMMLFRAHALAGLTAAQGG